MPQRTDGHHRASSPMHSPGDDHAGPSGAPPTFAPPHGEPGEDALPPPAPVANLGSLLPDTAIVPVAQRHDGWTADRQRAFIEHLADSGSVSAAARLVGMSPESAYRLRRRSDARAFDAAWEAALERAMQRLLATALDRAVNGTVRQHFYHGELVGEERVHSERLLIYLLEKGHTMLGHGQARRAISDNWGEAMELLEAGEPVGDGPPPGWRLWQDEGQTWLTNAPPPRGFDGYQRFHPGHPGYERLLTAAERKAIAARMARERTRTEQARRAFFGLDETAAPRPRSGKTPPATL